MAKSTREVYRLVDCRRDDQRHRGGPRKGDREVTGGCQAQAASAVEHPHIAAIYDVGETHGVTFMAMELIHGEKAYRLYAEGINLHERYREAEAATQFEKAIALDPTFAMAYAKLAVVHNNRGRQDLRDQYAELALKHGDRLTPRERYYIEGFHYSNRHATHRAEHGCLPQVH